MDEIIRNALTLVQDPYGNYVVQYVLELGDAQFSDKLIRQFIGHMSGLSVQKYSSNVMEKVSDSKKRNNDLIYLSFCLLQCIRVAEEDTRRHLIEEMVNRPQLEKMLKDSYANYVVQTALDFAEDSQHQKVRQFSNHMHCIYSQMSISWVNAFAHYYQEFEIPPIVSAFKAN